MENKIETAIPFKYSPIAIVFSDEKPKNAKQFKEGAWGCVMFMVAAVAKGAVAAFDKKDLRLLWGRHRPWIWESV